MKTYSAKLSELKANWWVIDANELILGRLASHVANLLRGKHKPTFTPSMDCGDHVIIINAEKIHLTGKKLENKRFYWHTGFAGGIKEINPKKQLAGKHPQKLVERAVERMITRGPLGRDQMRKLHVYVGGEHPHVAQQPVAVDFAAKNEKNKRRSA